MFDLLILRLIRKMGREGDIVVGMVGEEGDVVVRMMEGEGVAKEAVAIASVERRKKMGKLN